MAEETKELPPSKLGTRIFWEEAYEEEIENFKDHGDVGEVWFGADSVTRVVKWLKNSEQVSRDDAIVDVGCGNGITLIALAKEGFTNLTGIDYSSNALELAKKVSEAQGIENIKYKTCDIVSDEVNPNEYRIVLDKGTYDAVSLNPDNAAAQRKAYKLNISKIMKGDGLFILTSCNWTEDQLKKQFDTEFITTETIPAPRYEYGGKVGSTVSTLIFRKRS